MLGAVLAPVVSPIPCRSLPRPRQLLQLSFFFSSSRSIGRQPGPFQPPNRRQMTAIRPMLLWGSSGSNIYWRQACLSPCDRHHMLAASLQHPGLVGRFVRDHVWGNAVAVRTCCPLDCRRNLLLIPHGISFSQNFNVRTGPQPKALYHS